MSRRADPRAHGALLEAARAEFARRGLERARVEDIARRAGISKGAFYLHFDSKEDAFDALLQRFLGVMEEHIRRRQEAQDRFEREAGPEVDICATIDFECGVDTELLELMWHNRHILAALDTATGNRAGLLVADFRRRMRELLASRIAGKQDGGRLRRDIRPDVVADLIIGAYEDFGRRMADMKEKPDLAGWARSLLTVLYEGVLERTERTGAPRPTRAGSR